MHGCRTVAEVAVMRSKIIEKVSDEMQRAWIISPFGLRCYWPTLRAFLWCRESGSWVTRCAWRVHQSREEARRLWERNRSEHVNSTMPDAPLSPKATLGSNEKDCTYRRRWTLTSKNLSNSMKIQLPLMEEACGEDVLALCWNISSASSLRENKIGGTWKGRCIAPTGL